MTKYDCSSADINPIGESCEASYLLSLHYDAAYSDAVATECNDVNHITIHASNCNLVTPIVLSYVVLCCVVLCCVVLCCVVCCRRFFR